MDRRQFWARMQTEGLLHSEEEAYRKLQERIDKAIQLLKSNADLKVVIEVLEGKKQQ